MGKHSYFVYLAHPVAITFLGFVTAKLNIVVTAVHSMIFYCSVVWLTLFVAIIVRRIGMSVPIINELTIGSYKKK